MGLVPMAVWELFSLFYYGFPLPNTAYATLMGEMPLTSRLDQAFLSFVYLLIRDPQTLLLLAGIPVVILHSRMKTWYPWCIGILLYLIYIIRIGGDFIGGRFFTAPFLMAVIMAGQVTLDRFKKSPVYFTVITVIFGLVMPLSPLRSGSRYGEQSAWHGRDDSGVNDERGFYYSNSGLLRSAGKRIYPDHEFSHRALKIVSDTDGGKVVADMGLVGYSGYFGGRKPHLVDHYGLVDPMVARMPDVWRDKWRTGHTHRMIPKGHLETLRTGQNRTENPKPG
jgi:arabinofuranosyltransferase